MNIAFIGPRGVGKTCISKKLSFILKRPLFQVDELIVYEEGETILEIVSKKGWRYFREIEYNIIKKLSKIDNIIIDCGGGIVVDLDENENEIFSDRKCSELKKNAIIIWLDDDLKKIYKKIKNDKNRPLLSNNKSFFEIMQKRIAFYQKIADYKVNMHKKSMRKAICEIKEYISKIDLNKNCKDNNTNIFNTK